MQAPPDAMLTPKELEADPSVRIPQKTSSAWRAQRSGPPFYKLGRRVLYKRADVMDWLEARRAFNGLVPAGRVAAAAAAGAITTRTKRSEESQQVESPADTGLLRELKLPMNNGVYFLVLNRELIYIGQAKNSVVRRVLEHRLHRWVFDRAFYFTCELQEVNTMESLLIHALRPRHNGIHRNNEMVAPISKRDIPIVSGLTPEAAANLVRNFKQQLEALLNA